MSRWGVGMDFSRKWYVRKTGGWPGNLRSPPSLTSLFGLTAGDLVTH